LNESKATRYQRLRRRASAVEIVSGAVALGVLALPAVAGGFARWAEASAGGSGIGTIVLFAVSVVAVWRLAVLPARLFLGLRMAERYGSAAPAGAVAPAAAVATEELQATLAALGAALLVAGTVGAAMWLAPGWWWVVAGCALAGWLTLAMRAMPLLLARFAPAGLPVRRDLERRLERMAADAGVPVTSIGVLGGTGSPAAFLTGVGRTRRIFLSEEILRDWSDDEIAVVVAHEIGHHTRHDLTRGVALSAATLTAALWAADTALRRAAPALGLGGPADLGAWPLLLLVAGGVWLAATPLRHGQSRRHERLADEFALRLTGETDAFAAAIKRLGARHLAEERPSTLTRWFFHRHPSVGERLALASRFRGMGIR
jgi:STE24 endopeptidase